MMQGLSALRGRYFVTGTNTNVGKTWVSVRLLEAAREAGLSCYGLKPIAAGSEDTPEGVRNEDAEALLEAASIKLDYELVNPIAFREPVAPHILAQRQGMNLTAERLAGYVNGALMTQKADLVLVEGAGGWYVPINQRETLADLARQLGLPVILVVGMELGCLNHALLTAEAIRRDGLELAGWIANFLHDDMNAGEENFRTLEAMLPAPCLGRTDRN
jgi:dethiobiotin synthetase